MASCRSRRRSSPGNRVEAGLPPGAAGAVNWFSRWRGHPAAATPAPEGPPSAPAEDPDALPPSERCLFIIGAARSGSTVLQNALNDSPEIFLFGEPNFHADDGTPGFAARYNAMHRSWANQENKSSFCPAVLPNDGTWREYLCKLGTYYRFVGAKLVIEPARDRAYLDQFFDFQCRNFYRSKYIFTFRAPLPTISSTQQLQLLVQGATEEIRHIVRGYAEAARLYIRMLRNLPHVRAVFLEDADRQTFKGLEEWLGVPLPGTHAYYDRDKIANHPAPEADGEIHQAIAALEQVYQLLRRADQASGPRLQLEQNNNHLRDDHFTLIGDADRRLGMILRDLAPP